MIYFDYPGHEYEEVPGVRLLRTFSPSMKNVIRHASYFPLFSRRLSRECVSYIRSIADRYDVLYFDFSQVAAMARQIDHPMKIVRCHDVILQKYGRKNRMLRPWVRQTEKKVLCAADRIFVPSKKDADLLKQEYGFSAEYTHEYVCTDVKIPEDLQTSGFLLFGLWSREENIEGLIWFFTDVFPLLCGEAKSDISVMGGGLSPELNEKYLMPHQVRYLGFVDDSYGEILRRDAVLVPLFHGAGVKVKVLDAYSTGTPVIGTPVAFEGIPEIEGLQYTAESGTEFARLMNSFQRLTPEEKRSRKDEFLLQYDNRHLSDMI